MCFVEGKSPTVENIFEALKFDSKKKHNLYMCK